MQQRASNHTPNQLKQEPQHYTASSRDQDREQKCNIHLKPQNTPPQYQTQEKIRGHEETIKTKLKDEQYVINRCYGICPFLAILSVKVLSSLGTKSIDQVRPSHSLRD
ncbi:hypothetical protein V6N13_125680 [Hibiscus sabdariffa]|uniref:Uncharacterized protein n=1 Tax=Hibiscus sabdariffa TaxID=183260 RepID=A0ABR2U6A9_9ROSI